MDQDSHAESDEGRRADELRSDDYHLSSQAVRQLASHHLPGRAGERREEEDATYEAHRNAALPVKIEAQERDDDGEPGGPEDATEE